MSNRDGIWRFAGPLRWLTIIMVGIYSLLFTLSLVGALFGFTEPIFGWIDIVSTEPLALWQIAFGAMCLSVVCLAMIVIAIASNRLLKQSYRFGFLQEGTSQGLKQLGWGLILLWLGFILAENFMPWALTVNLPEDQQKDIIWFILDPNLIAMLVGFVLLLLSDVVEEAREIDAENKQII